MSTSNIPAWPEVRLHGEPGDADDNDPDRVYESRLPDFFTIRKELAVESIPASGKLSHLQDIMTLVNDEDYRAQYTSGSGALCAIYALEISLRVICEDLGHRAPTFKDLKDIHKSQDFKTEVTQYLNSVFGLNPPTQEQLDAKNAQREELMSPDWLTEIAMAFILKIFIRRRSGPQLTLGTFEGLLEGREDIHYCRKHGEDGRTVWVVCQTQLAWSREARRMIREGYHWCGFAPSGDPLPPAWPRTEPETTEDNAEVSTSAPDFFRTIEDKPSKRRIAYNGPQIAIRELISLAGDGYRFRKPASEDPSALDALRISIKALCHRLGKPEAAPTIRALRWLHQSNHFENAAIAYANSVRNVSKPPAPGTDPDWDRVHDSITSLRIEKALSTLLELLLRWKPSRSKLGAIKFKLGVCTGPQGKTGIVKARTDAEPKDAETVWVMAYEGGSTWHSFAPDNLPEDVPEVQKASDEDAKSDDPSKAQAGKPNDSKDGLKKRQGPGKGPDPSKDKPGSQPQTGATPGTGNPGGAKAGGAKPGKPQPGNPQPSKSQPSKSQPSKSHLGTSQPGSSKSGNPQPGNPQSGNSKAGNPQPGNPQPGKPQPSKSNSQPGKSQVGSNQPNKKQPQGGKAAGTGKAGTGVAPRPRLFLETVVRHGNHVTQIKGAPPADTALPGEGLLDRATLDDLLAYFPNHCLEWPGLAIMLIQNPEWSDKRWKGIIDRMLELRGYSHPPDDEYQKIRRHVTKTVTATMKKFFGCDDYWQWTVSGEDNATHDHTFWQYPEDLQRILFLPPPDTQPSSNWPFDQIAENVPTTGTPLGRYLDHFKPNSANAGKATKKAKAPPKPQPLAKGELYPVVTDNTGEPVNPPAEVPVGTSASNILRKYHHYLEGLIILFLLFCAGGKDNKKLGNRLKRGEIGWLGMEDKDISAELKQRVDSAFKDLQDKLNASNLTQLRKAFYDWASKDQSAEKMDVTRWRGADRFLAEFEAFRNPQGSGRTTRSSPRGAKSGSTKSADAKDTTTAKPSTTKPNTTKPSTTKPSTKPSTTQPSTTKPTTDKPSTTQSTDTKPTATKTKESKPMASKPLDNNTTKATGSTGGTGKSKSTGSTSATKAPATDEQDANGDDRDDAKTKNTVLGKRKDRDNDEPEEDNEPEPSRRSKRLRARRIIDSSDTEVNADADETPKSRDGDKVTSAQTKAPKADAASGGAGTPTKKPRVKQSGHKMRSRTTTTSPQHPSTSAPKMPPKAQKSRRSPPRKDQTVPSKVQKPKHSAPKKNEGLPHGLQPKEIIAQHPDHLQGYPLLYVLAYLQTSTASGLAKLLDESQAYPDLSLAKLRTLLNNRRKEALQKLHDHVRAHLPEVLWYPTVLLEENALRQTQADVLAWGRWVEKSMPLIAPKDRVPRFDKHGWQGEEKFLVKFREFLEETRFGKKPPPLLVPQQDTKHATKAGTKRKRVEEDEEAEHGRLRKKVPPPKKSTRKDKRK